MVEYLHLLMLANDEQRPLHERIGFMNVLATTTEYMDNDSRNEYERIKGQIAARVKDLFNPAHAPRP